MLEAVLFDWGDTLMRWAFDVELLARGHIAGLEAIGREPDADITARFRDVYLPKFFAEGGIEASDDELERFLDAEHRAWGAARQLASTTHALLDALRADGLLTGLVSNAFDPPALLHRDLAELGVAERLDAAVFSSEVGRRKPDPAIFLRALELLDVRPEEALFVGDRLYEDVRGAGELGMATAQALWFRADEHPDGGEPDFRAFTQMAVLNAARRLRER